MPSQPGHATCCRLSNLRLGRDIKGHGRATSHKPELVLNNFGTRLGHRIGRMFASLFSQDPNFKGRRVVTFHNQRDFVFVRHHRWGGWWRCSQASRCKCKVFWGCRVDVCA